MLPIEMFSYLGAAFAMGLGAVGAGLGIGLAGSSGAEAVARQPHAEGDITKTMLVGQAITESPAIFALVVSIILAFNLHSLPADQLPSLVSVLGAGLCMGFGAIGAGVGSGFANSKGCEGVGKNPTASPKILTVMLIGQAVCQAGAINSLIVSFSLLFGFGK